MAISRIFGAFVLSPLMTHTSSSMLWSNPQTVDLLAFRTSRLETESTKLLKLPFGGFKIIMKNEFEEIVWK
ncbi:hypothetical protein N7541_009831 [Penicillium brevicompactum]|uniref:Uncharacterized protein n=1 Tax=Penicillium brevicompactum TaxID=5074 RepID=A0A9W9QMD3_PENBR|nr:hypothetical protein N7541_009831 [Penicillium brevicompactum]